MIAGECLPKVGIPRLEQLTSYTTCTFDSAPTDTGPGLSNHAVDLLQLTGLSTSVHARHLS